MTLSAAEARLRDYVRAHHDDDIALLERVVNISSGTRNVAGVRRVGDLFAPELAAMGFAVRWADMPASMHRAGHLVAERRGTMGARLLLIGHLDGSQIIVVMTGDEESAGSPLELARRDLIDAKRSDVALAFEGGRAARASIARRGSSGWTLNVTARQGHPPESRGAGDVSFVAPHVTGMDGLGVGRGAHSPEESVNLNSLRMAAERAAVLMHRLIMGPAPEPPRP